MPGRHREGEAPGTRAQQEAKAAENEKKVVKAVERRGNTHQSGESR